MSEKWFDRFWFGTMGTLFILSVMLLIVALLLGVPVFWEALQDTYAN